MPIDFARDYDYLVAAYALRDSDFATRFGALLLKISKDFFGHYAIPDVVSHGLKYFLEEGNHLPKAALKADMALVGNSAIARDTYNEAIDNIFNIELAGKEHVENTIVEQARLRKLLALGPVESWIQSGRHKEYLKIVREVENLGVSTQHDQLVGLTDDFDIMIQSTPKGVPTGFSRIDAALNGGGICPGELLLILGRYNVGKSQMLGNIAVNAARQGRAVFFVSFETSLRNTRTRLAKIATGWNDDQIKRQPRTFGELVKQELDDLPLFVRFTSGLDYTFAHMERDIKQIEERSGKKVELVIRDYGELMADDPDDYRSVRRSYKGFKDFVAKHAIAGLDACQKNRTGQISHFNLLKDADILVNLDKPERSEKLLHTRIERNREGPAGITAQILVDRPSGQMEEQSYSLMIEDEDEGTPSD